MKAVRCLSPVLLILLFPAFLLAQRPLGGEIQVNVQTVGAQQYPHLATNRKGEFVVTWISSPSNGFRASLYARRFAADGAPATGEILVAAQATNAVPNSAVAMMDDGSFVVVFPAGGSGTPGSVLAARWYAPDGTPVGTDVTVTANAIPDFAIATRGDGGFTMVWESAPESVWVRSLGPDHAPLGPEVLVDRNGLEPAVAVSPQGEPVVAWRAVNPAADPRHNLYYVVAQRFTASGSPIGSAFRVSLKDPRPISYLFTGRDGAGNILVVWGEAGGRLGEGTFARRFGSHGTPLGGTVRLGKEKIEPAMAMGGQGNFVVTWVDADATPGPFGADIFAQRFAADGRPLSVTFLVNSYTTSLQEGPLVGIGAGGGFVVVWESLGEDGSSTGVFARRFGKG